MLQKIGALIRERRRRRTYLRDADHLGDQEAQLWERLDTYAASLREQAADIDRVVALRSPLTAGLALGNLKRLSEDAYDVVVGLPSWKSRDGSATSAS
jgi:hypothetical protein